MFIDMKKICSMILMALVLNSFGQGQDSVNIKKEEKVSTPKILNPSYDYRLIGEIVDPQSNIVYDVKVQSGESNIIMDGPVTRKNYLVKDGKFDFSSSGFLMWGLTFQKEKYYTARVGISGPSISQMLEKGEVSIQGNTVVRKAKIVLYPYGEFDKNVRKVKQRILRFSHESGLSTIHGITIPYDYYAKDKAHRYTFKNEEDLPPQLIYIVPGKKEDGSNDGSIILKTNVPDSGFRVLEYQGDHFFRGMQEAPEDGYQPELVIRKEFGNFHQKDPYVVFYFRVMNYYGKGLVRAEDGSSSLEKDKVSLAIYFCINTKAGGRNTNQWMSNKW